MEEQLATQLLWMKISTFAALGVSILALFTFVFIRRDRGEDKYEKDLEKLEKTFNDKILEVNISVKEITKKIESLSNNITIQHKEFIDKEEYRLDRSEIWIAINSHRDNGCPLVQKVDEDLKRHIDSHSGG